MAAPTYAQLRRSLDTLTTQALQAQADVANVPTAAATTLANTKAKVDKSLGDQKSLLDAIAQAANDKPESTLFKGMAEEADELTTLLTSVSQQCDVAAKYISAIPR